MKTRKWYEVFTIFSNPLGVHRKRLLLDPEVVELMKLAYLAGRDQMIMKDVPTFDELIEELKR
jgi:hypothetical protein